MGRHHALSKPHHLYLSPPSNHTSTPFHLLASSYTSPSALIQSSSVSALSVGDRIPGFRVSAAFLSSLQSNIFIELDSNYDSPDTTPYCLRPAVSNLPTIPYSYSMPSLSGVDTAPPEALNLPNTAVAAAVDMDPKEAVVDENGVPLLKTFLAEDSDSKIEALRIIADSVAQQRNTVSTAMIYHPITIAVLVAAFAFLRNMYYKGENSDYIMVLTTFTGVVMAILGAVRMACGPYIFEAEKVGTWQWLNQGRSVEEEEETGSHVLSDSDEILLTKFGEEYIAAIVFRGVQPVSAPSSPNGKRRSRRAQSPSRHTRMIIRGWSVRQKYRRKEVGSAILEDAINIAKEKGWTADGIEFAADHANHKRVMPNIFNGPLDKFAKIAQSTLNKKLRQSDASQGKGKKRK